jgi:uncharacterized membrane protein SirB2
MSVVSGACAHGALRQLGEWWALMDLYHSVKHLHVACVTLSIAGFVCRGLWRISGRALPRRGWRHWAPHANDTVLLLAAIALAVITDQYPLVNAWLTAKMLGLLVYITLGWIALKEGIGKTTRLVAWALALAAFAYVVSVALTKNPMGFLIWLSQLSPGGGSAAS